ncbi:MAG: outer membrane protein transport protein, partial [Thermodesulfobacteriota bacterium]
MKIYNMFRLHYSVGVIMFVLFASIPINIKDSLAIENLTQWFSSAFEFNNPGAKSKGIGGAFVGKADDATAAVANPAGLAQLPGLRLYVEGRFSTWDTRFKAWPHDPTATPFAFTPPGVIATSTQEAEINFDDMTDLSFASITFPVKYKPYNIEFNASFFYNKLTNKDTEITLPMTFQVNPLSARPGNAALMEGFNGDIDLEIDEYGFSMAKSFFKDKLMFGASISVLLLDIESTWSTTYIDSAGIQHDPLDTADFDDQFAKIDDRDKDVAFRFGVLYRVTDNLMIGGSAQIMPEFDYDTDYILLLDENIATLTAFTDKSSLSVPDVFSLGLSYQITDNWGVFVEGKYIEYSDLMKGFVSLWGADRYNFDRELFDI